VEFLGVKKVLNLNGMMGDVTEGIQELSVFKAQKAVCSQLDNILTGRMALCAIYTQISHEF